ncbi:MarR family winged helix-turn-helix transcriptional regulator [Antarcticimicrobium luteum]|uniref:MarR family transcriptional regulator n=1 Tax=Antarcticimicrobium luteum TaxID=2547397 RepID=A0A4R5UVN7_9RHOB|nr:MarR family transcriptional regulator [Antarcticimicrobium luteum]TDK43116.1 MarR family transcriptional regulator [Antarcticimicrobium luteum]
MSTEIFDKDDSAGFLANQMARLFAAGLARRIRPLDLAPAQFMVLLELWRQDALSQAELVARLDVEQATMANTLARMERDGLIQRLPSKTDGRVRLACLTDRARALRRPATAAARAQNAEALAGLTPQERGAFLRMMKAVADTMRTARDAGPPATGGARDE